MIIISLLLLSCLLPHLSFSASVNVDIVNGNEARPHSRPYMVSIQKDGEHICGGFLISKQFVMTAAHCRNSTETLTVVAGAHNLKKSNEKSVRIDVQSYIKNPVYNPNVTKTLAGDIMILKLDQKVKLNNNITTIPIPKKSEVMKVGTACSVAGWGRLSYNSSRSSVLMEADVKIMNDYCKIHWGRVYVPSEMMCVQGYGGSCLADSGGPLVCKGIAVGVMSFVRNNSCNDAIKPNVYATISSFLPWIKNVTGNAI